MEASKHALTAASSRVSRLVEFTGQSNCLRPSPVWKRVSPARRADGVHVWGEASRLMRGSFWPSGGTTPSRAGPACYSNRFTSPATTRFTSSSSTLSPFWRPDPLLPLSLQLRVSRSAFFQKRNCTSLTPNSSILAANMSARDILPDNFRPVHYDIQLTELDFDKWTYNGVVEITGELTKPTTEIVLNVLEIKLQEAHLDLQGTKATLSQSTNNFSYNDKQQRATIVFEKEVPTSAKASLKVKFSGFINHDMAGFYRSMYKPVAPVAASVPRDDQFHYMLSTQFEACDARRAFPCFDEPNLKATFDFAIEIPSDLVALSNMPVRESKEVAPGKTLVSFERTPVMSTYLVAWAVGDFEYIEAFTERRYNGKQLPVRVYTTRGIVEQGRWALEHAPKVIDYFSEQFEIDYPLPKSDILAVHEFTHGAMENWGLVTYRTTAVLFDEKLSDVRFRNRVAYVVAHELAHQWFGNLVTMDWWDELWLNEGFATWAGWLATDYLHPDWNVWPQFVNEGMAMAFELDSIRASHPIQVPVRDALDVNQIFDHISYLKGCSVIRMLASHLGVRNFLKGVAIYLKKHQFRNAKTDALWSALGEASGTDVNALMAPWIEKIGHPVLTVTEKSGDGTISVKQSRFLSTGDVKPEDDTTTWWIPLALSGKVGTAEGELQSLSLTSKEETISGVSDEFYLLNSNATGFYQVNYPAERLAIFAKQLNRLGASDKIRIASSASDLAFSGYAKTSSLLSFLEGFSNETEYLVLAQALDAVATLKSVFADDEELRHGLKAFSLKLIENQVGKVGFDVPANDSYTKSLLRKRILLTAVANGHESITAEAKKRFDAYFNNGDKSAVHADLRVTCYRAGILSDPATAVQILKKEWAETKAVDGRELCLSALGHIQDTAIIKDIILPFIFDVSIDAVAPADVHILSSVLAANRVARPLLWERLRTDWEGSVVKKLGGNPILIDRLVKVSLGKFTDTKAVDEIEAFFSSRDTSGFNRTLETVKDKVRGRAAYRQRDAEVLKQWLKENGYLKN